MSDDDLRPSDDCEPEPRIPDSSPAPDAGLPLRRLLPWLSGRPSGFSLAWAAGFVDGEACIHVARQTYKTGRNDTYQLRVYITQNDRAVLEHFRRGLGIPAGLFAVKRTAQHNRQVYTLNYQGAHAMRLISMLGPHLVRKRPEALAAREFWVEGRVGLRCGSRALPDDVVRTRERLYRKLRRLK